MNGVGLTTVGRLLGHRQRETTAIYAHLDDGALQDAAAQAAAVIARAMEYKAETPPLPEELPKESGGAPDRAGDGGDSYRSRTGDRPPLAADPLAPPTTANRPGRPDREDVQGNTEESPRSSGINWL